MFSGVPTQYFLSGLQYGGIGPGRNMIRIPADQVVTGIATSFGHYSNPFAHDGVHFQADIGRYIKTECNARIIAKRIGVRAQ